MCKLLHIISSLFVLLTFAESRVNGEEAATARTSYGLLRGYVDHTQDGRPITIFKGIPFATPPVGDLRWRLPLPPSPWTAERDATKYSAACMSNSTVSKSLQRVVSEDCLYLNIFAGPKCSNVSLCPVIVYLHGGGLNYDSAVMFNDSYLIESFASQDVVLAVPAFRLGFTGTPDFGDPAVVPVNIAVYDIMQSLRFLKAELSSFGGDKEEMTLFGHSFGAALSVQVSFSPLVRAEMHFSRIVALSPDIRFRDELRFRQMTANLTERANCSRPTVHESIECLRAVDGHDLLAIQRQMEEEDPGKDSFMGLVMKPPLFPFKSQAEMYENAPKIDIVMGTTKREFDNDEEEAARGVKIGELIGARNIEELDEAAWKMNQSGVHDNPYTAKSQELFVSAYLFARALKKSGSKVFLYSYDMEKHNSHTDDLSYIMGVHKFRQDENEEEIARFYPRLFTNFSKTGRPSPLWHELDNKDSFFSIAVNKTTGRWPEMRQGYEKETVEFWTRIAPRLDKLISMAKASGGKPQFDARTGQLRSLILPTVNESLEADYTVFPVEENGWRSGWRALQFVVAAACFFVLGTMAGSLLKARGRSLQGVKEGERAPLLDSSTRSVIQVHLRSDEEADEALKYFDNSTNMFLYD